MNSLIRIILCLFFIFCAGVHIYGLAKPFSTEPPWSHVLHTLSYCCCLAAVAGNMKYGLLLFLAGSAYPFFYHARCAWNTYAADQSYNGICMLVVILLPLAAIWLKSISPASADVQGN